MAIDGVEGPGGNLAAASAAVTRYRPHGLMVAQGGATHFDLGVYANRRESLGQGTAEHGVGGSSPRAGRDGSQAPADPQLRVSGRSVRFCTLRP